MVKIVGMKEKILLSPGRPIPNPNPKHLAFLRLNLKAAFEKKQH